MWIERDGHENDVAVVCLAITNDGFVIGVVEAEAPVRLERPMLVADLVEARYERLDVA